MGRKGPCLHCGINSTPLWRQGPEEKAVLCNACGSRYRKWGNLQNYLPKKQLMMNNLTTDHVKPSSDAPPDSDNCTSCRRSPRLWKTRIPSKKRSKVVHKRMTPMQKFHKQLLDEWVRQGKPNDESSPEEVLLFDNVNNFIPGNEIGLGAILLKPADGTNSSA